MPGSIADRRNRAARLLVLHGLLCLTLACAGKGPMTPQPVMVPEEIPDLPDIEGVEGGEEGNVPGGTYGGVVNVPPQPTASTMPLPPQPIPQPMPRPRPLPPAEISSPVLVDKNLRFVQLF